MYKDIAGRPITVWIVGSSIVKHAFVQARGRPGGIHLGLQRVGVSVWWQFKGGMIWRELNKVINTMMYYESAPSYIILHLGGNDIGKTKVGVLRNEMKNTVLNINNQMPHTGIIWSQILPRIQWRHSSNNQAMNDCRSRINNALAAQIMGLGGCYLKYPDILPNFTFIQEKDGVHLTELGNDIFLNTVQGALELFITSSERIFPPQH